MSKPVNIVLDDEGHRKLNVLADVYAGGNRSLMMRRLLDARYFEHLAATSKPCGELRQNIRDVELRRSAMSASLRREE